MSYGILLQWKMLLQQCDNLQHQWFDHILRVLSYKNNIIDCRKPSLIIFGNLCMLKRSFWLCIIKNTDQNGKCKEVVYDWFILSEMTANNIVLQTVGKTTEMHVNEWLLLSVNVEILLSINLWHQQNFLKMKLFSEIIGKLDRILKFQFFKLNHVSFSLSLLSSWALMREMREKKKEIIAPFHSCLVSAILFLLFLVCFWHKLMLADSSRIHACMHTENSR